MNDKSYIIIVYLSFFIGAVIFSILINGIFLKFSKTLGIRNTNDTIVRWNPVKKPAIGGISFFIIFLLSTIGYPFFFGGADYFLNLNFVGVLIACSLGFLMGLYDDAFSTDAFIKAFTQITCGLILISTNTYINIFGNVFLNYSITLLWVVGLMNSINMLDNMDGITGMVSGSIIITVIISMVLKDSLREPEMICLIGVLAALGGFLYYNWYPSKMFMGDTGSQFLGVYLAGIGIIFFWNGKGIAVNSEQGAVSSMDMIIRKVLSVLLIYAVPLIDTTVVVIKRLSAGKSPFIGGKDHTAHHLSYLGLTDKQVGYIFMGLCSISMLLTIIVISCNTYRILRIAYCVSGVYLLVVFSVLFYIANLNKPIKVVRIA